MLCIDMLRMTVLGPEGLIAPMNDTGKALGETSGSGHNGCLSHVGIGCVGGSKFWSWRDPECFRSNKIFSLLTSTSSRMNTRGAKTNVPDKLRKHTQQELREAKEAKQQKQEVAKAQKKEAQENKKKKTAKRVAAQEDKQLLEDKNIQSLQPDLDATKSLPKVSQQSVASVLHQLPAILAQGTSSQVTTDLVASVAMAPSRVSSVFSPIPSPTFDLAIPTMVDNDDGPASPDGDILPSVTATHTSKSEGSHPDDIQQDGGSDTEDTSSPDVLSIQVNVEDDADNGMSSSDEYQQAESSASDSENAGQMDIDKEFAKFLEMKRAKMAASKTGLQDEKKMAKGKKTASTQRCKVSFLLSENLVLVCNPHCTGGATRGSTCNHC